MTTGHSRKERRKIFDEENFDLDDRLDRAFAWTFVVVLTLLAAGLARFFLWP